MELGEETLSQQNDTYSSLPIPSRLMRIDDELRERDALIPWVVPPEVPPDSEEAAKNANKGKKK
jgi:hypothetical protein